MSVQRSRGRAGTGLLLATSLLLGSCTLVGSDPGDGGPAAATDPDRPSCRVDGLPATAEVFLTGTDPVAVATAVAATTHGCSDTVVVASTADPWAAPLAAAVARHHDAPLLLGDRADPARVVPELERLQARDVVTVGLDAAPYAPRFGATTLTGTGTGTGTGTAPATERAEVPAPPDGVPAEAALALAVARHVEATRLFVVPIDDEVARSAAVARLEPGDALIPLPADESGRGAVAGSLPAATPVVLLASEPATATAAVDALAAAGIEVEPGWDAGAQPPGGGAEATPGGSTATPARPEGSGALWPPAQGGTVWLADPSQPAMAAVAANAAASRGEPVLPVTARDLREDRERTMPVRQAEPDRAVLVGDVSPDAPWQLPVITSGAPLPGGGFRLFEDERMVALYGHPSHGSLGVLGEQDLDASVERARRTAAPYGADGARVLPAFEIIATVASAEAGPLGDYSRRTSLDTLRPYVERAAREGMYVVIDLQPGRTDFLTQAKEYEELLLEPHVGLALDPEWRLRPDQVHLRQIGSVQAPEVQQVVDWLAALTREHHLPQKLLVLHQFRLDMLPGRDTLVGRPEVAMVVHMDGQGPIGGKDDTYRAITAGAADRWLWGWKNFYDEDEPTPDPSHVLSRNPVPVFVSYQ